jgi:altronate dehydratase
LRSKGKEITYKCNQDVPFGHKIAIQDIKKGDKIVKYGEPIGSATQNIKKGDWVHTHNVKDDYIVLDKDGKPLTL